MNEQNTVNVPLLRKAVEWVEEQTNLPEIDREWDQRSWRTPERERAVQFALDVAKEMWAKLHPDEQHFYWVNGYTTETGLEVAGYYRNKKEFNDIYRKVENTIAPECKTAYCVAGYVCAINGEENLSMSRIATRAEQLLGLKRDRWQTCHPLFAGGNSAKDVRKIAEELAGERL